MTDGPPDGGDIGSYVADGGTVSGDESPFDTVSDVEITRKDQLYYLYESFIAAPMRIIWDDWRGKFGLMVVFLYLVLGLVGPAVYPTTSVLANERGVPPFQNADYILGTSIDGEDLLSQVVHATPQMFKFIIGGAVAATIIAVVWGTTSGYVGGELDRYMMAIADIMIAVPGLPLIIVLSALIEPSNPYIVGLLLAVNRWAGLSRRLRSQILSVRKKPYIEASQAMGLSNTRILIRDVLPNVMPYILVNFVTSARGVIISSVALYFLGVLPFTSVNWGVMLNTAYNNGALRIPSQYHTIAVPLVVIVLMSLGLILLGQAADRLFNPRLRARHESTTTDEQGAVVES